MSNPSTENSVESEVSIENGGFDNSAFVSNEPNIYKFGGDEVDELTYSKPYWSQSVVCRVVAGVLLLGIVAGFISMCVCMAGHCGKYADIESTGICSRLDIVSRAEWEAVDPTNTTNTIPRTNMTFLHDTAGVNCTDKDSCMAIVRQIQSTHMNVDGLNDIAYNFLVGEDGRVYEGRGWQVQGECIPEYDSMSHSISIIGNYEDAPPEKVATDTAKTLMDCGIERGSVDRDHELFGHRDASCNENCPGQQLYEDLLNWPHYSYRDLPCSET